MNNLFYRSDKKDIYCLIGCNIMIKLCFRNSVQIRRFPFKIKYEKLSYNIP